MKIFQKYTTTFLIFVGTMQISAMDYNERWIISNLQESAIQKARIASEQIKLQAEQIIIEEERAQHASNMLPDFDQLEKQVERRARWKRNKNLTNLVMNSDSVVDFERCKNRVMEMLGGYVGHAEDKKIYCAVPVDNKLAPWILIIKQCRAIIHAVRSGDCKGLKKSCGLLDACTSLFVSPQAPKSSEFIKNYKDNDSRTLLYDSIISENIAMTQFLLDRSANVDTKDNEGKTPLLISALCGKVEITKILLDHGARVDAQDNHGWTPLYVSVLSGELEIAKILLDRGAIVDIPNNHGKTPLWTSTVLRHAEIAKLLIAHGADVNIQDAEGYTLDNMTIDQEIKDLIRQVRTDEAKVLYHDVTWANWFYFYRAKK